MQRWAIIASNGRLKKFWFVACQISVELIALKTVIVDHTIGNTNIGGIHQGLMVFCFLICSLTCVGLELSSGEKNLERSDIMPK
mmetsp:Transcript_4387/g.6195  ORF Transcript_4387/g.6195 Transcript_4387/m.6195 type:complete len:84 (+) Transcript_4387:337-588(+)